MAHENTLAEMSRPTCEPVTTCDAFKGENGIGKEREGGLRCGERFFPALVTVVAVVMLLPAAAASQTPTDSGAPLRTAWGDPDLNGTWSYASLTPLQRPTSMADKEFFTPEEAAERNYAVTLDQPPRAGDVGSYNALWFDRGRSAQTCARRSSWIRPTAGSP